MNSRKHIQIYTTGYHQSGQHFEGLYFMKQWTSIQKHQTKVKNKCLQVELQGLKWVPWILFLKRDKVDRA
jgi:hypothetical protein